MSTTNQNVFNVEKWLKALCWNTTWSNIKWWINLWKKLTKFRRPTKTKNPYFVFCKDERPRVKADHPLYNTGQVSTELGRCWRELSQEEKQLHRDYQVKSIQINTCYRTNRSNHFCRTKSQFYIWSRFFFHIGWRRDWRHWRKWKYPPSNYVGRECWEFGGHTKCDWAGKGKTCCGKEFCLSIVTLTIKIVAS